MGKKHEANQQRDRIIALKATEPELSTSEIATRMGCAARTVTKVLSDHKREKGKPRFPNLQHIAIGFDEGSR